MTRLSRLGRVWSCSTPPLTLALGLLLVACTPEEGSFGASSAAPEQTSPNVLLISIDTLRPDHLSAYGYARKTSPRIDQLAAEGALFENAISSSSWTLPAHAALFTGLADSVHGCADTNRRLDDSRYTLAERFAARGYETVGFFSGPFLHPTFGLAQGFESFIDCSSYARQTTEFATGSGPVGGAEIESASHRDVTSPRVLAAVTRWLEARDRRLATREEVGATADESSSPPFLMFLHLWDVHFDFIPPPPYDTMFDPDYEGEMTGENFFTRPDVNRSMPPRDLEHILALYDGEIAWTDEHVGRILDAFDERALLERTIVVILSDHGEEFFEHGDRGHRHTLHDELIRIPLIVWYPDAVAPGMRLEEQVRMIDVLPTLLELAGEPVPDDVMGQSLAPLFRGEPLASDNLAISELTTGGRDSRSYRRLDRKRIDYRVREQTVVYDLTMDPKERLGALIGRGSAEWRGAADDASAGDSLLNAYRARVPGSESQPEISARLIEQLNILGYVDSDE